MFNFALAWAVPPGLSTIAYKTYFIFGTFNFAAFIHIFFMFPETAGRTLEEIEDVFNQGHVFTAWNVKRDVGKKTLKDVVGDKVSPGFFLYARYILTERHFVARSPRSRQPRREVRGLGRKHLPSSLTLTFPPPLCYIESPYPGWHASSRPLLLYVPQRTNLSVRACYCDDHDFLHLASCISIVNHRAVVCSCRQHFAHTCCLVRRLRYLSTLR